MFGFGQEIGHLARIDLGLTLCPALQKLLAPVTKGASQRGDKVQSFRCQYLSKFRCNLTLDLNILKGGFTGCHRGGPFAGIA